MAGLSVPLDEVVHFDVVTHDPGTGGRVTATSATFDVFEEATDTAIRTNLTLTERAGATGVFRGTDTISAASGYEVGKYYSVVVEATAGGVVGQAVALSFRVVAAESVAGVPKVDLTHIMGTILTEGGAGRLAAAFIKLLDVATPLLVASDVMRGTDSAALASVLGALNDAAAAGEVTSADTLVQYAKQIINTLEGAPGVPVMLAAAAPGNNISIVEMIRGLYENRTIASAAYFDPVADAVANVTLVATLTTYTGNTLQTGDSFARIGAAGVSLSDLGGMSSGMIAEVNAAVDEALTTTTYAEPGIGVPAATSSIQAKIGYLFKAWRNRSNQDATTYQLFNDDATTVDQQAAVSDNATIAEKGEVASG